MQSNGSDERIVSSATKDSTGFDSLLAVEEQVVYKIEDDISDGQTHDEEGAPLEPL